jgi:hypothetical protein
MYSLGKKKYKLRINKTNSPIMIMQEHVKASGGSSMLSGLGCAEWQTRLNKV